MAEQMESVSGFLWPMMGMMSSRMFLLLIRSIRYHNEGFAKAQKKAGQKRPAFFRLSVNVFFYGFRMTTAAPKAASTQAVVNEPVAAAGAEA